MNPFPSFLCLASIEVTPGMKEAEACRDSDSSSQKQDALDSWRLWESSGLNRSLNYGFGTGHPKTLLAYWSEKETNSTLTTTFFSPGNTF